MVKKTRNLFYKPVVTNKSINIIPKFLNIGMQDSEDGYYYMPHIQEEYEFIYIISGELDIYLDGQLFHVQEGDAYFVQPGQQHEEKAQKGFVSFYYLKSHIYQTNGEFIYLVKEKNNQFVYKCDSEIKRIFKDIFHETSSQELAYHEIISSQLMILICKMLRICNPSIGSEKFETIVKDSKKYGNDIINEVIEIINKNKHEFYSIEDLAEKCSVSTSYLFALFKKILNSSPIRFMTMLKIDDAKSDLIKTNMTVKSISSLYGFTDVNHFIKAFKRFNNGKTPEQYRKDFSKVL